MNATELPAELAPDAANILGGTAGKKADKGSVNRVWSWLNSDGYSRLIEADDDWIVADLSTLSTQWFIDDEMRLHKFSPLEFEDDPVDDAHRVIFARALLGKYHDSLCVDEDEFFEQINDDSAYPGVAAFELTNDSSTICFGVLLIPNGQAGFRLVLHGLFAGKTEFDSSLLDHGFIEVSPEFREDQVNDDTLLSYWSSSDRA